MVKIKDRNEEIEQFRLALVMGDISINYETADLIWQIREKFGVLGGEFSVSDVCEIKRNHEQRWLDYHKPKGKLEFKPDEE